MEDLLRPRLEAARLLHALGDSHTGRTPRATPIDDIADRLGVDVVPFHPATRRVGTLGWLEPGENMIFVQAGLPEPIRRFTLAHELGHFVLHRSPAQTGQLSGSPDDGSDLCGEPDLAAPLDALASSVEILRPGQAYSARAQRESEANLFAASLLLPADALIQAYTQSLHQRRVPPARRLRALAERFGVSEDVLLRRLTALLLTPHDVPSSAPDGATGASAAGERSRAKLDAWQRKAARAQTPALVVAGPGTGKTSTLVARVAYLVNDRGTPANSILALTFSNKAAREMRERIQALLMPVGPAEEPYAPLALPAVSTIHAFCGDLLRRYGQLVGLRPDFRLVSETDGYFLLRRVVRDLTLAHYQPLGAPAFHFPALLAAISRAKDELCSPADYQAAALALHDAATSPDERREAERALEVAQVYAAYQTALEQRGDADFGDLIRHAVRLLREQPDVLAEVRATYTQILVDEFQDINRAMGVLLHTLAGEAGPLWAVGDADQAIYRFRGASPANLSRFTTEYPAAAVHTLKRNYRSVAPVLRAAAGVAGAFLDVGTRQPLDAVRRSHAEPVVTFATAPSDGAELAGLVDAIRERADAGRSFAEQVVLCRTRRHCQRVATTLQEAGIPVRIVAPLLEQDDIKDVLAVLALLADPSGTGLLRAGRLLDHAFSADDGRALLAEAQQRHSSPGALLAHDLAPIPGISAEGRQGLQALQTILTELRQSPDVATGLARYIFGLTGVGQRLLASAERAGEAPAQASHIAQLLAMARTFEDQHRDQTRDAATGAAARTPGAGAGADWAGFLDYMRVISLLRQETGGAAEELLAADDNTVRVLTVHASKGLEFPVVYLPGLADRRFPSQRRGTVAPLPPSVSADGGDASDPRVAHLAEEACLFYVAITRARDELVVSYAERYGRMRYQPSPFLAPVQEQLGDHLRRVRWSRDLPASPHPEDEADVTADVSIPLQHPPSPPIVQPLHVSAIETYRRCPRQYAYRYVYGLRPSEIGLATLRRTLHATLRELHARFGSALADGATESTATPAMPVSLDEALDLFERSWATATEQERTRHERTPAEPAGDADAEVPLESSDAVSSASAAPAAEPFHEVYRRHGRQVVERAWSSLASASSSQVRPQRSHVLAEERAQFEHTVTVRLGNREIAVTLDRVEPDSRQPVVAHRQRRGADANGERNGNNADADAVPVRYVRHQLGRGAAAQPDMRTLLYTLAAEQRHAAPAALYSENLTTGEIERVDVDRRKLTRLHEELADLLAGMQSGAYPAKPDPAVCQTCPFLLICPA